MTRLSAAQATGIAVTIIIVLGKDPDVVYAMPLGLFAASLTLLFAEIPNFPLRRLLFARARR